MYCPFRYFASAPGAAENIRLPLPENLSVPVLSSCVIIVKIDFIGHERVLKEEELTKK